MRLSVDGKSITVFFATTGFDIRQMLRGGATDEEIEEAIGRIWSAEKTTTRKFELKPSKNVRRIRLKCLISVVNSKALTPLN